MNTETIYTITAACTLIAAGITSFPYRLSYGNTSWLPWWMQPDSRYLERPYEYDYPARNINLLFSVSVVAIGILAMLFILTPDLPDDVPAERWFAALAFLYPAYAFCQVLFWRKDYGDGFCYAGRITSFSYGKVYTILLTAATTFALYLTNVMTLPVYRGVSMVFCLLSCLFLIYDYIRVFRLRGDNEYSDPIGIKEMYPESWLFRLLLSCLRGLYGGPPLPAPLVSPFCCRCTRCYAICSVFTLQSKVTNTSAGAICGI